jgi:hypothetical protein
MLYGKINPVVEKSILVTPFSAVTLTGNLIKAVAKPYRLGATSVNFQVTIVNGDITTGDTVENFTTVLTSDLELSGQDLANWGTDDRVMLSTIATKLGTTITDFYTGNTNNYVTPPILNNTK